MFCFDPLDTLFNATIELVAEHPGMTVSDLHEQLRTKAGIEVTLQHVYRIVTRLTETQVLLKNKRTLSLNLLWLSHVELFVQSAKERLLKSQDLSKLAHLDEGGRLTFSVQTLQQVQALWHHLLIQINKLIPPEEERVLHKYYSHPLWLLHADGDRAFYERIAKKGVRCYWLVGNESFLDLKAVRDYRHLFAIAVTDHSPFPTEGYLLNILGDYILECVFPKAIADHVALLFGSVRSDKDWKPELLDAIFHLRGSFKITVTRSRRKAPELAAKIERLMPQSARPVRHASSPRSSRPPRRRSRP